MKLFVVLSVIVLGKISNGGVIRDDNSQLSIVQVIEQPHADQIDTLEHISAVEDTTPYLDTSETTTVDRVLKNEEIGEEALSNVPYTFTSIEQEIIMSPKMLETVINPYRSPTFIIIYDEDLNDFEDVTEVKTSVEEMSPKEFYKYYMTVDLVLGKLDLDPAQKVALKEFLLKNDKYSVLPNHNDTVYDFSPSSDEVILKNELIEYVSEGENIMQYTTSAPNVSKINLYYDNNV